MTWIYRRVVCPSCGHCRLAKYPTPANVYIRPGELDSLPQLLCDACVPVYATLQFHQFRPPEEVCQLVRADDPHPYQPPHFYLNPSIDARD